MTSVPSVGFMKLTICLEELIVIFCKCNYGRY